MKLLTCLVALIATIVATFAIKSCQINKQFMTFQMDCASCNETENIDHFGNDCCYIDVRAENISIANGDGTECCTNLQDSNFGMINCAITDECYRGFYGTNLSDLSFTFNGVKEDSSSCGVLTVLTTPAYQTTSCDNCDGDDDVNELTTTELPSSAAKVSALFSTICGLLIVFTT